MGRECKEEEQWADLQGRMRRKKLRCGVPEAISEMLEVTLERTEPKSVDQGTSNVQHLPCCTLGGGGAQSICLLPCAIIAQTHTHNIFKEGNSLNTDECLL